MKYANAFRRRVVAGVEFDGSAIPLGFVRLGPKSPVAQVRSRLLEIGLQVNDVTEKRLVEVLFDADRKEIQLGILAQDHLAIRVVVGLVVSTPENLL